MKCEVCNYATILYTIHNGMIMCGDCFAKRVDEDEKEEVWVGCPKCGKYRAGCPCD